MLSEGALNVLHNYVTTKLDQYMVLDFRSDLFRHAQRLSLAFHDQKRSGMLIYAINFHGRRRRRPGHGRPAARAELHRRSSGCSDRQLPIDWQLALLSLTVVPFLYASVGFYAEHIQPRLLRTCRGWRGRSLSIIHEAISMLRVIVAFGREDYEHRRFRGRASEAVEARVRLTVRQTLFSLAVDMITGGRHGAGARRRARTTCLKGKLTVGAATGRSSAYIAAVYKPLEAISYTVGSLQEKLDLPAVGASSCSTPSRRSRTRPARSTLGRARRPGRVPRRRLPLRGPRPTRSRDISFAAEPGQVIAIVGPDRRRQDARSSA